MKEIFTIGHSTRSIDEFLELLLKFNIKVLTDVRSMPGSRRFPHFNKENIGKSLEEKNIGYIHIKELGGRRKVNPHSINTAWRHKAFRGFADHIQTDEFKAGMAILTATALKETTALMCSEAVWWRCHRSIISDYLKVNSWKVFHIINNNNLKEHLFTQPAKVIQGELFYRE